MPLQWFGFAIAFDVIKGINKFRLKREKINRCVISVKAVFQDVTVDEKLWLIVDQAAR